jgi:hypothetical protein
MIKTTKLLALTGILLATAASSRAAITTSWVDWVDPGSYPEYYSGGIYPYNYATGTNGTITMPDNSTVNVTLAGEIMGSYGASAFGTTDNAFWSNANYNGTTYISTNVPTLPTNSDRIGVAGSGLPTQTLTFSSGVTNILMNIWSLGDDQGNMGTWRFNQPFVILSQNAGQFPTPFALQSESNNTLNGYEGMGTIQFTGTFSELSWEVLNPEVYAVWNIGVTSASAPDPSPVPEPGQVAASILLLAGIAGYAWMKRRKLKPASDPIA